MSILHAVPEELRLAHRVHRCALIILKAVLNLGESWQPGKFLLHPSRNRRQKNLLSKMRLVRRSELL